MFATLQKYRPLIVVTGVSALAGLAVAPDDFHGWMHGFMGSFLLILASLKLFTPSKFADGFQMYDLLARVFRPYGYAYPYIELGLGLAYLAHLNASLTYAVTIIVFGFGTLGVLFALKRGMNVNCACMGNVLNVPLSTVTLVENISMIAMAAWMLAGL